MYQVLIKDVVMAGKSYREGITLMQLADMFPTEDSAREWFEACIWPDGRHCPTCKSTATIECKGNPPLPYWCPSCKRHFSVRVGTLLHRSKISFRKWVWALYLHLTNLKGVSSVKLGRDIGVRQPAAWFMLHRIRKAFDNDDFSGPTWGGPTEVDETYIGGLRKNMSKAKRKTLEGRGPSGKAAVVGAKDRKTGKVMARHVRYTDSPHLAGFAAEHAKTGTTVYTDEATVYRALDAWFTHESVNHSAGEYVRGMAHINGIESFWAMLKRAHKGIYHKFSVKHLDRYIAEFSGRHNMRECGTLAQMVALAGGMTGKRLTYKALIADNGLKSGAHS